MHAPWANRTLSRRFSLLIVALMAAACLAYSILSIEFQRNVAQDKAIGEARVLQDEIMAVWEYMDDSQEKINYNSDGAYDFKGVYCTVAAKEVAKRFMQDAPCTIRFVRENPRSGTDEPDAFEQTALQTFGQGTAREYSEVVETEQGRTLRYVSALLIDDNCLACHGSPAGEKDETGFLKEGMQKGDIAGAVSISVPLAPYEENILSAAAKDAAAFAALLVAVLAALRFALQRWVVGPLSRLERAAESIESRNFDVNLSDMRAIGEMKHLADAFSSMARELKTTYSGLESQVAARTEELAHANAALQEANEALQAESAFKSSVLGVMGHELRTPAAAIQAAVSLWKQSEDHSPQAGDALAEVVKTNSETLLSTVENTLDAARIDAGRFRIVCEEVDIFDVLGEVEAAVAPLASKKDVRVTFDIDRSIPIVKSDGEALRKIALNLAGNAVKFAQQNGAVEVRARFDENTSCLHLNVHDNGAGIADADQEKIFERFTQVDASRLREHGGIGLGLSLVRDLVGLLEGKITLESSPGQGSTFNVTIPVEEVAS